jgi:hypothetical protein
VELKFTTLSARLKTWTLGQCVARHQSGGFPKARLWSISTPLIAPQNSIRHGRWFWKLQEVAAAKRAPFCWTDIGIVFRNLQAGPLGQQTRPATEQDARDLWSCRPRHPAQAVVAFESQLIELAEEALELKSSWPGNNLLSIAPTAFSDTNFIPTPDIHGQ